MEIKLRLKEGTPFHQALVQLQAEVEKSKRDLPITYSFNLRRNLVGISFPNVGNIAPFQRPKAVKTKETALQPSVPEPAPLEGIPGRTMA